MNTALEQRLRSALASYGELVTMDDAAVGSAETEVGNLMARAKTSRRRRRRLLLIGVGSAALVATGTGLAAARIWFGSEPVTNHDTAKCYSKISSDFGSHFPGGTVAAPKSTAGGGGQVVAPVRACANAWEMGVIQGISPALAKPPYPVPHLVACVLPDGTAAVFPGPAGTCQKLQLATALPG